MGSVYHTTHGLSPTQLFPPFYSPQSGRRRPPVANGEGETEAPSKQIEAGGGGEGGQPDIFYVHSQKWDTDEQEGVGVNIAESALSLPV